MSIFGTLDCSFSSHVLQKAKSRRFSMLLHPVHCRTDAQTWRRRRSLTKSHTTVHEQPAHQFEKIFIRALVQASSCHGGLHSARSQRDGSFAGRTSYITSTPLSRRHLSSHKTDRSPGEAVATEYDVSREELKRLVDHYPPDPNEPESNTLSYALVSGDGYGSDPPDSRSITVNRGPTDILDHLRRLLEDKESPHEEVFAVYQELPQPRAQNIPEHLLRKLLHHLSIVEQKSHTSMQRYLSILEDLKAASIPLKISEWTSAIAFTGRASKAISAADVESALNIWRAMENDTAMQANNVTFNVLFDVATKAGKFVLAEMIMKEMQRRGLPFNRYFRTGLIYHYGLRADGDGVRRSYRELVDAGEIVDAAVIACVIASLLKCGEAVAAEQVFERAKHLHAHKTENPLPPPPQHWRERRDLGRYLDKAARRLQGDAEAVKNFQETLSLSPDYRTYKALVYYHAVTAGDLDRVTSLVAEMDYFGIPMNGTVFVYLFKGFGMHGGVIYTSWTRRRLEGTWTAFRRALAVGSDSIYMSRSAAVMVLRAFAKCATYERVLEVWGEVGEVWEPGEEDGRFVEDLLEGMGAGVEDEGGGDGEGGGEEDV